MKAGRSIRILKQSLGKNYDIPNLNGGSENGKKSASEKDIMKDKLTEPNPSQGRGICQNYFEVLALGK